MLSDFSTKVCKCCCSIVSLLSYSLIFGCSNNVHEHLSIYGTGTQRLLFSLQCACFSFSFSYPTHSANAAFPHGLPHITQILLLTWKMAHCANHKGMRKRIPSLPTSAVLCYLLTVSLFILLYLIFLVRPTFSILSISTSVQPPRPWHCLYKLCNLFLFTLNVVKRFGGTHIREWEKPSGAWMDELSGSQNCVDDPDFMQAKTGKYKSLPTQPPKGDSHVRKIPRMGVKEEKQ